MTIGKIYTKDELVKAYKTYITEAEVARKLGISRQFANTLRRKFGISYNVNDRRKSLNDHRFINRNKGMLAHFNKGADVNSLSKIYKISPNSIRLILKKMGVKIPTDKRIIRNKKIYDMYTSGIKPCHIAIGFKLPRKTVYSIILKYKKKVKNGN